MGTPTSFHIFVGLWRSFFVWFWFLVLGGLGGGTMLALCFVGIYYLMNFITFIDVQ